MNKYTESASFYNINVDCKNTEGSIEDGSITYKIIGDTLHIYNEGVETDSCVVKKGDNFQVRVKEGETPTIIPVKSSLNICEVDETVTTMLPIVGLNGPVLSKDKKGNDEMEINFNDELITYMKDPKKKYDELVSESAYDIVLNQDTDINVNRKIRKLIIDLYMLDAKIKNSKNIESAKLIDMKRELVSKKKELNSYKSDASSELRESIKKLESLAKKETSKYIDEIKNKDEKEVKESVDDTEVLETVDNTDSHKVSFKDLTLEEKLSYATEKFNETGEIRYKKAIKGLIYMIEHQNDKPLDSPDNGFYTMNFVNESTNEEIITESRNMEDEIKPIVDELNRKGYKVKYASPGHKKLRKKEDSEPDGVYYNKLYSDARIMFKDKYDFPPAPEFWKFREVDGCSYLDIKEKTYSNKNITPDEDFAKWKADYMKSLKDYVDSLKPLNDDSNDNKEIKESVSFDEFYENMISF